MALLGLVLPPVLWVATAFVVQEWHTYLHAFRLTVETETPSGPRSASSVIRVVVTEKSGMLPETDGVVASVKGEAVFLDLGDGHNLVALLALGPNAERTGPLEEWAPRALGRLGKRWYRKAPRWTGRAPLGSDLLPTLATFADPANVESARPVRPAEFEAVFGPGYRFVGASLEMADAGVWPLNLFGLSGEPPTRAIEQQLSWVDRPLLGLRPLGRGIFADTRTGPFVLRRENLKRER